MTTYLDATRYELRLRAAMSFLKSQIVLGRVPGTGWWDKCQQNLVRHALLGFPMKLDLPQIATVRAFESEEECDLRPNRCLLPWFEQLLDPSMSNERRTTLVKTTDFRIGPDDAEVPGDRWWKSEGEVASRSTDYTLS